MVWAANWEISINGQSIMQDLRPFLNNIKVGLREGSTSDTCSLSLDDAGGRIIIPNPGAILTVGLNGKQIFKGKTDDPKYSDSRGGGQVLRISAKGFDTSGTAKEPMLLHMDDATLQEFMDKVGKEKGMKILVDPDLANIKRPYWSANQESLLALGQRLKRELGATFKIQEPLAILAPLGKNFGIAPIKLVRDPTKTGDAVSVSITPRTARPVFKAAQTRYYDRSTGKIEKEDMDFGESGPAKAVNVIRSSVANKDQAKQVNEARKRENDHNKGAGTVRMPLNENATYGGTLSLSGWRAGVDGSYFISSVDHSDSRSSGGFTSCGLKHPHEGAGKDSRAS